MSIDPIEQGLQASENFLVAVDKLLKEQILNSWPDKIPGLDYIARQLESGLASAESTLRTAENEIKTQIEPLIKSAIPNALDVIGNLTRVLDDNLSALIKNIATTEDVTAVIVHALQQHSPQLAHWFSTNVAGALGNTALGILKEMETQDAGGINAVLDAVIALPNQPAWFKELTHGFRHRGAEWQALALPALLVSVILAAVSALEEPLRVSWQQLAFGQDPSKQWEVPDIITAHLRGYISDADYDAAMREHGFHERKSSIMLRNAQPLLDPETITRSYIRGNVDQHTWETELLSRGLDTERAHTFWHSQLSILNENDARESYLRGFTDAQKHDAMLARLGYQEDAAALRRQLYFYIPPPADLIHMGIRNVFTPEIVERFELDHDKPEAFVKAAHQQGISDDWAGKYWQAHWIMPGRDAFFEMYQRTIDKPLDDKADRITLSDGTEVYNIIGRDTLNLALRDIDTPPFYRDKLTEIAYHPLTRIDIRRMAAIGELDHAGVERAYLDLGYSHRNAERLASFVDKLNARTKKDETAALTDNLRRQIIRLYTQEKLSSEKATTALSEVGASDAEIAVYLAEADVLREAEDAVAHEAGIGKLYMAGLLSDKDATKRMMDVGIPVDAMSRLFAKWDLEIQYRGGTPHIHAHRELTKSEVLSALVDGLLSKDSANKMLEDLGYGADAAQAEINLALYKAAKSTKTAQIDAVKASYTNGTIEELEASNRLDALLVPSEQRDAYIATWTLQRETRTERIPIATLRDMVKGGYVTEEETLAHLRRHRFTEEDATLLLRFWKNQKSPKGLVNVSGT